MKFRTKKYLKDRDKSKERSQKGELRLLENKDGRSNIIEIVTNLQIMRYDFKCEYMDDIGCTLPYIKRTLLSCKKCPIMK